MSGIDAFGTTEIGGEDATISGMTTVRAGEGEALILGSDDKGEYLAGGKGNATIWSNAGKDTFVGTSGIEDQDGVTTFVFKVGDGKDTLINFNALTADNADTADKIWTYDSGKFEQIRTDDEGNVKLMFDSENTSDQLIIANGVGKNIQLSEETNLNDEVTRVLNVGINSVAADGLATEYYATGAKASVIASGDDAEVWLKDVGLGSATAATFTGDYQYVNASAVEGNAILAGNDNNNVITGAQGDTSLWGGNSTSDDMLIAGGGDNMFWYGVGQGDDTISGADEEDVINVYNLSLDAVNAGALEDQVYTSTSMTLKFKDGGSLTLDTNAGTTFQLSDGSRWAYSNSDGGWRQA